MKHQVLFFLKNNEKFLWLSSAAVVISALRVKIVFYYNNFCISKSQKLFVHNKIWHSYPMGHIEICCWWCFGLNVFLQILCLFLFKCHMEVRTFLEWESFDISNIKIYNYSWFTHWQWQMVFNMCTGIKIFFSEMNMTYGSVRDSWLDACL